MRAPRVGFWVEGTHQRVDDCCTGLFIVSSVDHQVERMVLLEIGLLNIWSGGTGNPSIL